MILCKYFGEYIGSIENKLKFAKWQAIVVFENCSSLLIFPVVSIFLPIQKKKFSPNLKYEIQPRLYVSIT